MLCTVPEAQRRVDLCAWGPAGTHVSARREKEPQATGGRKPHSPLSQAEVTSTGLWNAHYATAIVAANIDAAESTAANASLAFAVTNTTAIPAATSPGGGGKQLIHDIYGT